MLRISGTALDVDSLVASTSLVPEAIHRKGEPRLRTRPEGEKNAISGASFLVSGADFDRFEDQKKDAIAFLSENKLEVKRIMSFAGTEEGCLDFGIFRRDVAVQCDCFPPPLVRIAGEVGLAIEISQYWPSEDDEESQPILCI